MFHIARCLDFCLPLPFPFSPLCFFGLGCDSMSASWTGSASKSVVICPKVCDARMLTAISQANVSHSDLMFGSLCAFLRVNVLNRSMYVVTSFSAPICMRIQAHWIASSASRIIIEVWGSQSFCSCCMSVLLLCRCPSSP